MDLTFHFVKYYNFALAFETFHPALPRWQQTILLHPQQSSKLCYAPRGPSAKSSTTSDPPPAAPAPRHLENSHCSSRGFQSPAHFFQPHSAAESSSYRWRVFDIDSGSTVVVVVAAAAAVSDLLQI